MIYHFFSFGKCLKKKTYYFWSSSCLTQTMPELHWNDAVRVRYIRPVLHQHWQTDISFFPPVYSSYPKHLSWPSAQLSCPFLLLKISTKILSISSRKLPYCTFISRSRKMHWSQLFTNPYFFYFYLLFFLLKFYLNPVNSLYCCILGHISPLQSPVGGKGQ